MIQDFINDGSLFPSFKKSIYFNNADMEEMVKPLKKYHKKHRKPLILRKKTKKSKTKKSKSKKSKSKKSKSKSKSKSKLKKTL